MTRPLLWLMQRCLSYQSVSVLQKDYRHLLRMNSRGSRSNGQSSCPSDDDYVCNKFCPEYFHLGDVNPIDENAWGRCIAAYTKRSDRTGLRFRKCAQYSDGSSECSD